MTTGSLPSSDPSFTKRSILLRRNIGLVLFVLYGVGNILGAGIYVITGEIAAMAKTYAPLSFLTAGLIATLSALAYAEISARFPASAGEAEYVQAALKSPAISRICGLAIVLAGIVSAATIIRGFSAYARILIEIPSPVLIALTSLALTAIAVWGIKESALVAAVISIVEAGGLLLILVAGSSFLAELPERWETHYLPAQTSLWPGILLGSFTAFYAFIGFEDMVNIAEEVKNPRRNLPLGILLSLGIASILYIGVSYVATAAMPPEALSATESPLAELFTHLTGYPKSWFSWIASLAVINGALVQVIMSSRILYGMSQMKLLWPAFSRVHAKTQTPILATLFSFAWILAFALALPTATLARATSFIILTVFFLVHLSLIILRSRDPAWQTKGVSFPRAVPVAGMIVSIFFLGIEVLY